MPFIGQTVIDGVTVSWGSSDDRKFEGLQYVVVGDNPNHTTFIVDADFNIVQYLHSRGADRYAWAQVAIAVITG